MPFLTIKRSRFNDICWTDLRTMHQLPRSLLSTLNFVSGYTLSQFYLSHIFVCKRSSKFYRMCSHILSSYVSRIPLNYSGTRWKQGSRKYLVPCCQISHWPGRISITFSLLKTLDVMNCPVPYIQSSGKMPRDKSNVERRSSVCFLTLEVLYSY